MLGRDGFYGIVFCSRSRGRTVYRQLYMPAAQVFEQFIRIEIGGEVFTVDADKVISFFYVHAVFGKW